MIELDRRSKVPLGDQLVGERSRLVEDGVLAAGARLPSVRQLARRLGISSSSVVNAYGRLISTGVIESRRGSGHFVSRRRKISERTDLEQILQEPTDAVGYAVNALDIGPNLVRAGSGFLPADWFDEALPSSVIGHILRGKMTIAQTAPAQGLAALRRRLAQKLQQQWISVSPGLLVTTFGASHAFSLLARALIRPGDPVLVEDPGYFVLHAQLASNGARLVPVTRQADGPDIDAVEAAARLDRPRLFFTQTLFHNPTGTSTSAAKCHRLLALAERYNFYLVEDDVYGDLAQAESVRLAHLDELSRVFYVSSFTKVLSPGLRVGFIAAPAPFVQSLVRQKLMDVVAGSAVQEYIICDVLESGRYARHLTRIRNKLLKARASAETALSKAGILLESQDSEGVFLWGRMPGDPDIEQLAREALAKGIFLAQGSFFSPTRGYRHHLRFNAAYCEDARLLDFLKQQAGHRASAGKDLGRSRLLAK